MAIISSVEFARHSRSASRRRTIDPGKIEKDVKGSRRHDPY